MAWGERVLIRVLLPLVEERVLGRGIVRRVRRPVLLPGQPVVRRIAPFLA